MASPPLATGTPRRTGAKSSERVLSTRYQAVHARLRHTRGPARQHRCKECGEQATQWAYDRSDPNELTDTVDGQTVHYSADLARYEPLCRPCHASRDNGHRMRSVRASAVALYRRGLSLEEVATKLGCGATSVGRLLRAAEIPLRPAGRPRGPDDCKRCHPLAGPNLVPKAPTRQCLACMRAKGTRRRAQLRGEVWTEQQVQACADEHYQRILSAA